MRLMHDLLLEPLKRYEPNSCREGDQGLETDGSIRSGNIVYLSNRPCEAWALGSRVPLFSQQCL